MNQAPARPPATCSHPFVTWLVALVLAAGAASAAPGVPLGRSFVIGSVAREVWSEVDSLSPMAEHLSSALRGYGYGEGEVVVFRSWADLAAGLRFGTVDVTSVAPAVAAYLMREAGAIPVAVLERNGRTHNRCVIVSRLELDIESPGDLEGHRIAFVDRGSTCGFVVAWFALVDGGLDLAPLASFETPPGGQQLGYLFSGSAETSLAWLLTGRVDAAALADEDLEGAGERLQGHYRVLHRSEPVLMSVLLARPSMNQPTREEMLRSLHALKGSLDGRELLWGMRHGTGLRLPGEEEVRRLRSLGATLELVPELADPGP